MMGRDLCGLPVFSWEEGIFVGRVADFFIHSDTKGFLGISLGKKFPFHFYFVSSADIRRIYKDGIIISSRESVRCLRFPGEHAVSYLDFSKDRSIFLREGEVVSDVIFDERFFIDGYEISGGLWNDLVRGRTYRPRKTKSDKYLKNGR